MGCNDRPLLPRIALCLALLTVLPAAARDAPAACAVATDSACKDVPAASLQNASQRYPLAGLLGQSSESGFGLAFAAVMIGALALRVGLR